MRVFSEHSDSSDIGQLCVFRGDEESEVDNRDLSAAQRQAQLEWEQQEAFWAGRNRAKRLSARLAA